MRENPSSKLNYTTSLRNLLITYNLRIGFVVHILRSADERHCYVIPLGRRLILLPLAG